MKPLNRPMFRYGGPIKEGVMSGIQERVPYKTGGGYLKNLGGAIANFYNPLKKARPIQKIINKIKPTFKMQPGQVTGGTKGAENTLSKYMNQTMAPPTLTSRVKAFAKENPFITGMGAPFVASGAITAAPPVAKGIGSMAKSAGLQLADLAVPDFIFDQDQYFKDKEQAVIDEENEKSKLTANELRIKELEELLAGKKDPPLPQKSIEEIRAEKRAKYRDIMDIKGMNKDAAYNSLIAASQLINQEGDFKGSLKDGSLINKLIAATSKQFDKPVATKDAINTLIAKAEIEKDINLSKGNSSTQQIKALADASGRSEQYVANAKLGIANTPGEAKQQLVKLKKTPITSDDVTSTVIQFAEENNIPFKKQFTTEQKSDLVGKGKKYSTVVELIDAIKLNPNGADDGLYVVGTSIVEVENGIPKLKG